MGSRSALHDIQSATHMARAVVGVGGAAGWSHDFECWSGAHTDRDHVQSKESETQPAWQVIWSRITCNVDLKDLGH